MSKSLSLIFTRLQFFPYIVYVRKVKIRYSIKNKNSNALNNVLNLISLNERETLEA